MMKKTAFVLSALFMATVALAQEATEKNITANQAGKVVTSQNTGKALVGPAAKNAKPWELNETARKVVVVSGGNGTLMGPAAKNAKPWLRDTQNSMATTLSKKERLMGPAAKNRRP